MLVPCPPEVLMTIRPLKVEPETDAPLKGISTLPWKLSVAQKDRWVR